MQRQITEKTENVWEKVYGFIKLVTGDVDVAGKGNLQEQIDNMGTHTDSVSVIDDAGRMITTTYADGTKTVAVMDDTSILENTYDTGGNLISRTGVFMNEDQIEVKELGTDEE
ncbi:MAG: hypothetical protein K2I96_12340 [Lachnospiraceae bacterium]|nr:hypothetical protein [Lachnospiraceae bacterium]